MIIIDDRNVWRAIELKAIKKTNDRISPSYYFGIGQAFAYLAYGMDEVALWQCFDANSMTDREISDYYRALGKIRAPIECLIDTTFIKILVEKQKIRIQTAIFGLNGEIGTWSDGIGIRRDGEYKWTCRSYNPFLVRNSRFDQDVVNKVKTVREFLELQRTEIWDGKNAE